MCASCSCVPFAFKLAHRQEEDFPWHTYALLAAAPRDFCKYLRIYVRQLCMHLFHV